MICIWPLYLTKTKLFILKLTRHRSLPNTYIHTYLSFYLSIDLSIYLPIYLSTYSSVLKSQKNPEKTHLKFPLSPNNIRNKLGPGLTNLCQDAFQGHHWCSRGPRGNSPKTGNTGMRSQTKVFAILHNALCHP